MKSIRACAIGVVLGLLAGDVGAQRTPLSRTDSALRAANAFAWARVGKDWLEILFPPVELADLGCPTLVQTQIAPPAREYVWHAFAVFRDSRYPNNHFVGISVLLRVPDPLIEARLDSALSHADLTVDESRGEPAMTIHQTQPRRSSVRRQGEQVRFRVEGKAAVKAFMQARPDTVTLGWCQRSVSLPFLRVPLVRR